MFPSTNRCASLLKLGVGVRPVKRIQRGKTDLEQMTDDRDASEHQSLLDDDDTPQSNTDFDVKQEFDDEDLDDTLADPSSQEGGANGISTEEGWLCVCVLASIFSLSHTQILGAITGDNGHQPPLSKDDIPFSQRLAIYRRQEESRLEKVLKAKKTRIQRIYLLGWFLWRLSLLV